MTIEVVETSQIHQDLEIELIVEKDHIEIIVIEIMNEKVVERIPVKGKFVYILIL